MRETVTWGSWAVTESIAKRRTISIGSVTPHPASGFEDSPARVHIQRKTEHWVACMAEQPCQLFETACVTF